jgi:3-phenylpropionate/trans-cinnamate dioxygenase ferredoxin reductase subunit
VVFRGDPATREFIAFWVKDERVVAGMNVNVWDVNEDIQAIVRSRRAIDPSRLSDPQAPLSEMVEA